MEPADIDWKSVESRYIRDELYEHINAPKWIDLAASDASAVDDEAWFCRPDCRHPKTAEDFQRWSPSPKVKLMRSSTEVSPLGQRNTNNHRDAALKRRGGIGALPPSSSPRGEPTKHKSSPKKLREDLENQNPNLSTPPATGRQFAACKMLKEAIKSSAEKREVGKVEEEWQNKKPPPRLKSTLSARNLFSGKDILSQISDFYHEIKKLSSRKERNAIIQEAKKEGEEKKFLLEVVDAEQELGRRIQSVNLNSKRNVGSAKKCSRMPLRVEIEKEKYKKGGDENSLVVREVRAFPPTPQRFPSPSTCHPGKAKDFAATTSSPLSKATKSSTAERGILQELEQSTEKNKALVSKDEEFNRASGSPEVEGGRSVDVFWFLKPCSYLA